MNRVEFMKDALREVVSHRSIDEKGNYSCWIGESTFEKCEKALRGDKPRCLANAEWTFRDPNDPRCKFSAWKDGYCKRHHPEIRIATLKKRIPRLEEQLRKEKATLEELIKWRAPL